MRMGRRIAMYFAWARTAETSAPLGELDNRFPALFEVRRLFWPAYETLAHSAGGQGIDGFLEAIFLQNFARFAEQVAALTGQPLRQIQRRTAGGETPLDAALMDEIDTLLIIGFDSQRTGQVAAEAEITAVRAFLVRPDAMLFVCPHHDIGDTEGLAPDAGRERQVAEFRHHGDIALPGQQRFGGFGLSLMAGLGAPIRNRFGLRPARADDGAPAPFNQVAEDRFGILTGVPHLNLHPHLPHYERVGAGADALEAPRPDGRLGSALGEIGDPGKDDVGQQRRWRTVGEQPLEAQSSLTTLDVDRDLLGADETLVPGQLVEPLAEGGRVHRGERHDVVFIR
jgi:hypothetical protein